ncbi:MAG: efflux RND transporter periplasmic adaptor subunit, partial [Comamonadaceae bacterium]
MAEPTPDAAPAAPAESDPSFPHGPAPAHVVPTRKRRWVGRLVALLVLGALIGGSYYLMNRPAVDENAPRGAGGAGRPGGAGGRGGPGGPGGPGAGATVTVGQATVQRMRLPITLDALGTVTPLVTATITPQVGGTLAEVLFTEGQKVTKGQVLARIDPRTYEQALAQARGTRSRDEAQLEAARVTLQRYRTLLGQDSIARQDVDTQAALVKQLEGTVLSDKAAEDTAKLNLSFTRITSPVTGTIGLRTVDPGNQVTANSTTGIATVTQINPIDVVFSLPQDRVPEVQAQAMAVGSAKIAVDAMDRTRGKVLDTGRFSTLNNTIDTTTGTVKAKARFDNTAGALFPNQFVNVRLTLRTIDALVVPVTAVRTGPGGPYVYVIAEDRTVKMRNVKRGEATVEVMAITDGLAEGEKVVTEGGDRLSDGSRVQLQGDAPRTPGAGGGAGRRRGGGAGGGEGAPGATSGQPAAPAGASSAPAGSGVPERRGPGGGGDRAPGTASPAAAVAPAGTDASA